MVKETFLKNIQLFNRLPDETLAGIYSNLKSRSLSTGEILFNQGDPGDQLIIVEEGKIAIFAPVDDDDKK